MQKVQAQKAIQQLKRQLIDLFGPAIEIYLFGSVARGDFDVSSDIDIMIIFPEEVNIVLEEKIFDLAYPIELENNVIFGIIVYSKKFWYSSAAAPMPLKISIEREGVIV